MFPNQLAIDSLLARFDSHGLRDLDRANLQNRVDSKFMLPLSCLPKLLEGARQHYSVLEIEGKRTSNYFNEYFDTQQMRFYRDHHNGKLNRYKVRKRTYLETQTQFLEVKFKNNQKRTLKSRVRCDGEGFTHAQSQAFLNQHLGEQTEELKLAQVGGYQRIALANEEIPERLTLDFNLWYRSEQSEAPIELKGFFIAELKQSKRSKSSPFYQLLPEQQLIPNPFSKYCIGCALTHPGSIKYNRFKPTLMKLGELLQSHSLTPVWSLQ